MRVLVVTKRFYTGRDLLEDRYGRMWELPYFLAQSGHSVQGVAFDYHGSRRTSLERVDGLDLAWRSVPRGAGLVRHNGLLAGHVADFRPDLIWVASDVFHVIAGVRLGIRSGVPVVADLYDNYESFAAARLLPGSRWLFRRALARAQGLSCVSATLARKVRGEVPDGARIAIIENAVDPSLFHPLDRRACRQRLGLPVDGRLVGVAGALSASRGIDVVGKACRRLRDGGLPVRLAVAGPRDRHFVPPATGEGFDLGMLEHADVPTFINALDVAVVSNIDSDFGRYCFPVKLYETLACGVPLVAASVGAVEELLGADPGSLFQPASVEGLATAIRRKLDAPKPPGLPVPAWGDQAAKLEMLFTDVIDRSSTNQSG